MYPTSGARPSAIRSIHGLYDELKKGGFGKSDEECDRMIDGGYRGRACQVCFVKFSKTGACNCP